jgi:hypothetical protein
MKSRGFGVGCYVFVPTISGDESRAPIAETLLNARWWRKRLETDLGPIASITNLKVSISEINASSPPSSDIIDHQNPYDLDYNVGPIDGSYVSFTVTIPERMQGSLMLGLQSEPIGCERFYFVTYCGQHGPATFVHCVDEPNDKFRFQASNLVILVREFLRKEIERTKAPVEFISVAPSPFWGDFELVETHNDSAAEAHKWEKMERGYDHITFTRPDISDMTAELDDLFHSLLEPFSIYYKLIRDEDRRRKRSELISERTADLIRKHEQNGILGWTRKTFRSGGMAQDLLLSAITVKQLEIQSIDWNQDVIKRLDIYGSPEELRQKCKASTKKLFIQNLESSQEVAKLLEGGRMKKYEVFMLTAATALGGAAGAIAAIVAR